MKILLIILILIIIFLNNKIKNIEVYLLYLEDKINKNNEIQKEINNEINNEINKINEYD